MQYLCYGCVYLFYLSLAICILTNICRVVGKYKNWEGVAFKDLNQLQYLSTLQHMGKSWGWTKPSWPPSSSNHGIYRCMATRTGGLEGSLTPQIFPDSVKCWFDEMHKPIKVFQSWPLQNFYFHKDLKLPQVSNMIYSTKINCCNIRTFK